MTEAEFQSAVLDLAATFGWKTAHFRASRTLHGWTTAVSADGAGWPDLVLVHPERQRVLFRELKSNTNRLSPAQQAWAAWLRQAGADYCVWRPTLMAAIVDELSFGQAVTT